ncbi:YicC/YloC family endoribonuclease [Halalkalibacter urbisdiaboli]|uniref:YicC/YloC family endoribonuclease n=1 Tax=Halalkalibacter urbisdiaboli TaxID=1960589 RepID=UPI000B43C349|nr:YicC/YloC family endoribonuclease [Halalkalibacter urbisdiaboli]
MHSMTGYGLAKIEKENIKVIVEAKSVNHRFLECSIRIPHSFLFLEEQIRKVIKSILYRGKIDLFISVEGEGLVSKKLELDVNLLKEYKEAAAVIESVIGTSTPLDVNRLLQNERIVAMVEEETEQVDLVSSLVLAGVEDCLQKLMVMRKKEGEFIHNNFEQILVELEASVASVEQLAPQMAEHYKERLEKRMRSFTKDLDMDLDEGRLLTEIAIFAERVDISEELVRLLAHIEQFRQICNENQTIGRKLDFLVQEMNREANTLGSKANHTEIRQCVVEMKSLIEKLKEQVQNVE